MNRYAYDPGSALRAVSAPPPVLITQGVKGCWVVGRHDGIEGLMAAMEDYVEAAGSAEVESRWDYGVSMDGSNAEQGALLLVPTQSAGLRRVTISGYGPAQDGFYKVNVDLP